MTRMRVTMVALLAAVAFIVAPPAPALAADFEVTPTADTGPGSLRAAITHA